MFWSTLLATKVTFFFNSTPSEKQSTETDGPVSRFTIKFTKRYIFPETSTLSDRGR